MAPWPAPQLSAKDVDDAWTVVREAAWRTPTVPASRHDDGKLYVKLECLQRTGSFKLRGAWNKMSRTTDAERARGFVTVSAGNHGQAVAWSARRLGAPCTVWVPDTAVDKKVRAMEALGAVVRRMPHAKIMESMTDDRWLQDAATYVHPFADGHVLAGQGTIAREVFEDVPQARTIVAPVGGGGLSTGIATWVRAYHPECKVYGVQAEGAGPLPASWKAGRPVPHEGPPRTIADGMAATLVFDYMWPLLRERLDGAFAVSDDDLKGAIRHLAGECKVVAEGAGAGALAAARRFGDEWEQPVVCIVSGGNIDASLLASILAGT